MFSDAACILILLRSDWTWRDALLSAKVGNSLLQEPRAMVDRIENRAKAVIKSSKVKPLLPTERGPLPDVLTRQ